MKKINRYALEKLYRLKRELLKLQLERKQMKLEEKQYVKLARCR